MWVVYRHLVFFFACIHLSLYVGQQLFLIFFEVFVYVHIVALVMPYFVEAIHVKLANEGREIVMFKVLGQDHVSKAVDILDAKGIGP